MLRVVDAMTLDELDAAVLEVEDLAELVADRRAEVATDALEHVHPPEQADRVVVIGNVMRQPDERLARVSGPAGLDRRVVGAEDAQVVVCPALVAHLLLRVME